MMLGSRLMLDPCQPGFFQMFERLPDMRFNALLE